MSEGYPFFTYARDHNLPYGDVIAFADAYSKHFVNRSMTERAAERRLSVEARIDIINLCKAEAVRRLKVIGHVICDNDEILNCCWPDPCKHTGERGVIDDNDCEQEEGA
jgi:hypothetical protein